MSSGVVKFSVPISSSLPQRPQFLQRSAAFFTSLRVSLRLRASRVSYDFGTFSAPGFFAIFVDLAAADFVAAIRDAPLSEFCSWKKARKVYRTLRRRFTVAGAVERAVIGLG